MHKGIVFLQLFKNYGAGYFDSIRNWDKEKNKLLALYGYSLEDDIKGKFEFTYADGKPFLRVLDSSIKRVALVPGVEAKPRPLEIQPAFEPEAESDQEVTMKIGLVITSFPTQYPNVQIEAVQGEANDELTKFCLLYTSRCV